MLVRSTERTASVMRRRLRRGGRLMSRPFSSALLLVLSGVSQTHLSSLLAGGFSVTRSPSATATLDKPDRESLSAQLCAQSDRLGKTQGFYVCLRPGPVHLTRSRTGGPRRFAGTIPSRDPVLGIIISLDSPYLPCFAVLRGVRFLLFPRPASPRSTSNPSSF